MLKSVMQVENYVESMLKISMCVENMSKMFMFTMLRTKLKTALK